MSIPFHNPVAMDLALQPRRSSDWAKRGKPVLILTGVTERSELVDVSHGHICSSEESHLNVDNVRNFVVWSDKAVRTADNADDAHETVYSITDPRILSHFEVGYLYENPQRVFHWFKGKVSPETAEEIANFLRSHLINSLDHL